MNASLPRLSTAEAAARLRVRPETLYAYVSRGQISRMRDARGSWFDPLEIEAFARRAQRSNGHAGSMPGSPLMVVDTNLTLIEDNNLYFRGRDAITLAHDFGFERTAGWVWHHRLENPRIRATQKSHRRAIELAPASVPLLERLQLATIAGALTIPALTNQATSEGAILTGSALIDVFAVAAGASGSGSIAQRLARGWRSGSIVPVIDIALTLAIDHDLAVSTLAARVAASARARPTDAIAAALGAFSGPLHGSASLRAIQLLRDAIAFGPEAALTASLAKSPGVAGFGHHAYAGTDPRARAILDALAPVETAAPVLECLDSLQSLVLAQTGLHPNVDVALAALVVGASLPDEAATAIFAIGRTVGWIAHIAAEYDEAPMRLRPHGRFVEDRD